MPTYGERLMGNGGNLKGLGRKYVVDVAGSADPEQDVVSWVLSNAPSTLAGLVLNDITLEENPEVADLYEATAQYGTYGESPTFPSDSLEYRFNFQAQGGHFYQSLATILYSTASGSNSDPAAVGARAFGGALNVIYENGKPSRNEGVEVQPPPETFTLAYYPVNATVSGSYQTTIEGICGTVNNATYKGRSAGSLMLVRATGGVRTGDDWSIEFGFGYVANQTNIPVGDDIVVTAKDGLDLLCPFYNDKIDAGSLIKSPFQATVERVWYRSNFSGLALPS